MAFVESWPDIHDTRRCPHGKVMDDDCDDCYQEETGHYPQCGVYEGTQQGPCNCARHALQSGESP